MHKVLITGSRDWEPEEQINAELAYIGNAYGFDKLLVIHGGCKGVDLTAEKVAKEFGIHTARVDARWNTYHKSAGPIRNKIMLLMCPDEALAFHPDIKKSRGTANMVKQLEKASIPIRVISE